MVESIPKSIAIALCLYQGERFLTEQLDSILIQTLQNFHLHIFDDSSTDTSIKIIQQYQKIHHNIHLHQNKQRLGFMKNFEQAIRRLSSEQVYLALCDQDDIWHQNKLEQSYQALIQLEQENPDMPCLVHSDLQIIDSTGKLIHSSFFTHKKIELPHEKSLAKILGYNGVMANTILINHRLAQLALPFPESLKYHDYWLALVNETFGIRKTLNTSLISYRIHNQNASENRKSQQRRYIPPPFTEDNRKETLAYLLSHYELEKKDKKIISAFYHYLDPNKNKIIRIVLLLKHNFLHKHWRYRLRILRRILLS